MQNFVKFRLSEIKQCPPLIKINKSNCLETEDHKKPSCKKERAEATHEKKRIVRKKNTCDTHALQSNKNANP